MSLTKCVLLCAVILAQVNFCLGAFISLDSSYVNIFRDPIGVKTDTRTGYEVPPLVIYNGQNFEKPYKLHSATMTIPPHVDFFAFNLWSGTSLTSLHPFNSHAGEIYVEIPDNTTLSATVETFEKETVQVRVNLHCLKDVDTSFNVHIPQKRLHFSVKKTCNRIHLGGFMVYTANGDVVSFSGKVAGEYNVHDARGVSYISTEEEGVLSFIVKSLGPRYNIVGAKIDAYEAPQTVLDWIAVSRPSIEEDLFEQEIQGSHSFDEDEDYYQDDDDDDKVEKLYDSKEAEFVKLHALTPEVITEVRVAKKSDVCAPVLAGAATHFPVEIKHAKRHQSLLGKGFDKAVTSNHMKQVIKNLDSILAGGVQLDVDFHCVKDGIALLELSLMVQKKLRAGGQKKEILKFSWIKICESKHVEGATTSLMGFDVRLGAYIDGNPAFYAVRNGRVTQAFTASEHEVTVSPEETQTSFYATISPEVWFNKKVTNGVRDNVVISGARVKIAKQSRTKGNDICEPMVYGRASHDGVVTVQSLPLVVQYNCLRSGSVIIQLNLDLKLRGRYGDEVFSRLKLAWVKICERTPTKTLQVRTINPQLFVQANKHLDTASKQQLIDSYQSDDVVVSGVVNKAFSPKTVQYIVDSKSDTIAFEIRSIKRKNSKTKAENEKAVNKALEFSQPKIVSSSTICHASIRPIEDMEDFVAEVDEIEYEEEMEGKLSTFKKDEDKDKEPEKPAVEFKDDDPDNVVMVSGNLGMFAVNSQSSAFIVVDLKCVDTGETTLTLTIPFEGNHRAVISWKKQCNWTEARVTPVMTLVLVVLVLGLSVGCMWMYNKRRFKRFLANKGNIKYFKSKKNTPSGFEPMELNK